MEIFMLKLAVAVIPLIFLVAFAPILSTRPHWYTHHPLAWRRQRRQILRALAQGALLR